MARGLRHRGTRRERVSAPLGDAETQLSPLYFFGHQKWYADRRNVVARPNYLPMPGSRAAETLELGALGSLASRPGGSLGRGRGGIFSGPLHGSLGGHTLKQATLSDYDLEESSAPTSHHYPALAAPGDWPALRPAGPEPLDPGERGIGTQRRVTRHGLAGLPVLSRMEKTALLAGGAAIFGWWYLRRRRRKRR